MFKSILAPNSIGIERSSLGIQAAVLAGKGKSATIVSLATFQSNEDDVKQLYIDHPVITSGMEGKEVLIRSLTLPLTKEKDIKEALSFQAEPLLPYPSEQAFLAYQLVSKNADSTDITVFAVKKEAVKAHVESWKSSHIEPEKVSAIPSALSDFGASFLSDAKNYLILHLLDQEMTCVLIKEGKLIASFSLAEGISALINALSKNESQNFPVSEEEWMQLAQSNDDVAKSLKRLQNGIAKNCLALAKEMRGVHLEGIVVAGIPANYDGLSEILIQNTQLPLLACAPAEQYSSRDLLKYAVPIGLAIGSLSNRSHCIDFRREEAAYPNPWKRLKFPLAIYFTSMLLLACMFYFFSAQYLKYQESEVKQMYIDLLSGMNKSHEDFEIALAPKNAKSSDSVSNEIVPIERFNQNDLIQRISLIQKELQASPDSFPLYANTPRVSDFLAWLQKHPAAVELDGEGKIQPKLQIENFNYMMVKRPQQGKKQDKYQVKIELEFSSPTPKWAREFHDALIAPNDWIDPKGEVKWNTNRGKYKTSFFLKDKTAYPGS